MHQSKKNRMAEWIRKQDPRTFCLRRSTSALKAQTERWKRYFVKWKPKKVGVAVLTSDKIDFETKAINKRGERAFHNGKGITAARDWNPHRHTSNAGRA